MKMCVFMQVHLFQNWITQKDKEHKVRTLGWKHKCVSLRDWTSWPKLPVFHPPHLKPGNNYPTWWQEFNQYQVRSMWLCWTWRSIVGENPLFLSHYMKWRCWNSGLFCRYICNFKVKIMCIHTYLPTIYLNRYESSIHHLSVFFKERIIIKYFPRKHKWINVSTIARVLFLQFQNWLVKTW